MSRPGYTLDLVLTLKAQYPDAKFRLIAGTDIYHQKNKWHRYDEIARLAPPIYVERSGESPIPEQTLGPAMEVSSSILREALGRGEQVKGLTLESIFAYIESRGLYTNE